MVTTWERELGSQLPRPIVLSGDITEPGFGLCAEDTEWVKQNCHKIIHSAAILEFYGKDRTAEPWRTNLNGTENMINLCRDLEIHDIHYVSTAYVAGRLSTCGHRGRFSHGIYEYLPRDLPVSAFDGVDDPDIAGRTRRETLHSDSDEDDW